MYIKTKFPCQELRVCSFGV